MNTRLGSTQVSLLHVIEPSDHSASNHLLPPPKTGSGFVSEAYHGPRPVSEPARFECLRVSFGLRLWL